MGMDHNGAIDACECEDCQRRRGWLDELERLEREATPFPWEPVPGHGVIESPTHVVESGYRSEVNVRLIAALRNHARDLIEAARRCEELEAIVRRVAVGLKAHRDPLSSEGRRIDHYDLSNAIANAVFDTAAEAAQKGGA
jgi:hypothetical protein